MGERRFGEFVNVRDQVVSRNFFKDLDNPIFARDVFSQYELEYLNDNVRRSEDVGRENHYLSPLYRLERFLRLDAGAECEAAGGARKGRFPD